MADVRSGKVKCVLVWKYDRFARSLFALISAFKEFAELGVDFVSYTQNIDSTTPTGRLFFHIIASFAEFEREMIVERVNAGLNKARAKGIRLGRRIKHEGVYDEICALRKSGLTFKAIGEKRVDK